MKLIGFLITFLVLLVAHVAFLAAVDALPEPLGDPLPAANDPQLPDAAPAAGPAALPMRVEAKDIGLEVAVLNTASTDIAALDADLLRGAVRYPTSARLGEMGTVLLFGHSSYLPIVRNQNYKAFNNIQKLKEGQVVSVFSGTTEYRYTVTSVRLADATEDEVELRQDGQYLTLVTCNTFAAKTARYVVTAKLASTAALH